MHVCMCMSLSCEEESETTKIKLYFLFTDGKCAFYMIIEIFVSVIFRR